MVPLAGQAGIQTQILLEEVYTSGVEEKGVFIPSDSEASLSRLLGLERLSGEEKVSYTRNICHILESVPYSPALISQVVSQYLVEDPGIQSTLLAQVTHLKLFVWNSHSSLEQQQQTIISGVLPFVRQMLRSSNSPLREQAADVLCQLTACLSEEQRGVCILTILVELGQNDIDPAFRITSARLLARVSPLLDPGLCSGFLVPMYMALADDPSIRVRKVAVQGLPEIVEALGETLVKDKVLPWLERLSRDSMWVVRRAVLSALVQLTKYRDREVNGQVVDMVEALLQDKVQWVKSTAYQSLGRLIYQLAEDPARLRLLPWYFQMTSPEVTGLEEPGVLEQECAYYFYSTLLTCHSALSWPSFRSTLQHLSLSSGRTLCALLSCLHLVAQILGEKKTFKHLLPLLHHGIHSSDQAVRLAALTNFSPLLAILRQDVRDTLADGLLEVITLSPNNWRVRQVIALQIPQLCAVFKTETVVVMLIPLVFQLCNDQVAEVRGTAGSQITHLLDKVKEDDSAFQCVLDTLNGFALSSTYSQRMLYVTGTSVLIASDFRTFIQKCFKTWVFLLQNEKVPNVVIRIAEVMSQQAREKGVLFQSYSHFRRLLDELNGASCMAVQVAQSCQAIERILQQHR